MAKNAADKNPSVIFVRPNEVVIEDRDVPSPKDDELLIRTERSLISTGTELTHLSGESPPGLSAEASPKAGSRRTTSNRPRTRCHHRRPRAGGVMTGSYQQPETGAATAGPAPVGR